MKIEPRYYLRKLIPAAICMAACVALFAIYSLAQVQLPPSVKTQFFNATGQPLAGGCSIFIPKWYIYSFGNIYRFYRQRPEPPILIVLRFYGRPTNDIWLLGEAYRLDNLWPQRG